MKNGTSQAILVSDLVNGDGPYHRVAEAFLSQFCSGCAGPVDDDARFSAGGFLCSRCEGLGLSQAPVSL